jgi:hypothetical protein
MSSNQQQSPKFKNKESPEEKKEREEKLKKVKNAIRNKNKKSDSNFGYSIVIGGFVVVCVAALAAILFSSNKKLSATPVIDEEEMKTHNDQGYSFKLASNNMFQVNKKIQITPTFPY